MVIMLFSACSPSEEAIQEALEKTQTALPSPTIEVLQSTELSSPPDSGIISEDLQDYLLTEEDIAKEGYDFHYTKFGFSEPEYETTNDMMIESKYYDEFDSELIFKLNRITSWTRVFVKTGTHSDGKKYETDALKCTITSFETANDAKQAVEQYNLAERTDGLSYYNKNIELGDTYVIYRGGIVTGIEFSFNNVVVQTLYYGKPDLDITERFARIMLEKLQKANLANQD